MGKLSPSGTSSQNSLSGGESHRAVIYKCLSPITKGRRVPNTPRQNLWSRNWEKNGKTGHFPGGPMAKIPSFQSRGLSLMPAQGTRSCMPQLRSHMWQLTPRAAK